MSMFDDPSMKEIVIDFCDESDRLFDQLEGHLTNLENDPKSGKDLESFGQLIDRIMGAAKSIGADEIAKFCELGKLIGYKSSQVKEVPLVEVVVGVLFDALHMLRKMNQSLRDGNDKCMNKLNTKAFGTRLTWLSEKFKDIERASCALDGNLSQNSIDDLMKSLGL